MAKKYVVKLTAEERLELEELTKKKKADAKKVAKAHVLLKADEGWLDEAIVSAYNLSLRTVQRIREQFVEEGIEAVFNRKPTSRVYRRKIEGKEEAHLIALCCSDPPEGHARWTLQMLADKLVSLEIVESVSADTVGRTLKKTNLSLGVTKSGVSRQKPTPLLSATWKMS